MSGYTHDGAFHTNGENSGDSGTTGPDYGGAAGQAGALSHGAARADPDGKTAMNIALMMPEKLNALKPQLL